MKTAMMILLLLGLTACTSEAQQEVRDAFPSDRETILTDSHGRKWAVHHHLMDAYFITPVIER